MELQSVLQCVLQCVLQYALQCVLQGVLQCGIAECAAVCGEVSCMGGWLVVVGSLNYRYLLQKSHTKETIFCKRD